MNCQNIVIIWQKERLASAQYEIVLNGTNWKYDAGGEERKCYIKWEINPCKFFLFFINTFKVIEFGNEFWINKWKASMIISVDWFGKKITPKYKLTWICLAS